MEESLTSLRSAVDEQEFLRLTRTALRIVQNILNEPENAKFRTVRTASKYALKAGVPPLLEAIGFTLKGEEYTYEENTDHQSLMEKKTQIIASRKALGSVMGWDVPSSFLKFTQVRDKGRFGDVFVGRMDDQDVTVKVVRPDCNQNTKHAFDRELDILSKVNHPNIVQLVAVTLTSEPTSLVLEYIPHRLLNVLHNSEVSESEVLKYGQQLASAMNYLHQKSVLHCDLAARNLLLAADGQLRLSEFGSSRWDGTTSCHLPPSARHTLNIRWMPPETLRDLIFSRHSDVWSFGVVLYELLTGGSVPYATLSNSEIQSKVEEGYRLPQPQGCPEDLYHLMKICWARRPTDRPRFSDIIKLHLEPLVAKLANEGDKSLTSPVDEGDLKSLHSKLSKKMKVKELSYQSVVGKGGGLLRVYTALVSPFQHRVVIVCSRKSSVGEVVATSLAKCGKQDQDAKSHRMVLVSGPFSGSPAHYLDPEDKILSVKAGAPPTAMFILCVSMPGQGPLEIIDSVRQNPAYGSAFSFGSHGYLVRKEGNQGHRSWCVLDGSTLLCYNREEDEGVKQFESFLDFKDCMVELSTKGKSHIFKVKTSDGGSYSFLATSKDDMLQWVESISSAKTLDPSPLLLHTSEGAVIQASFMDCQEFSYDPSEGDSGNSLKPLVQRQLGTNADFAGTFTAIDYGKHWTVLRSSGLIQCLVKGRPETLFNLADCQKVMVNNPKEMKEGVDYFIEIENPESKFVMKAELPTEHCDWVLAIEQILKKLDHEKLLQGHRKRESGYVALKRFLLTGGGGGGQATGRKSQLYCFPRIFDDMEDIYDPPKLINPPPPKERAGPRSELLKKPISTTKEENLEPLPPKDYFPPPLPPRNDVPPPPLPPKGHPVPQQRPTSTVSSGSCSDADDDYVMMQAMSHQSSIASSPATTPQLPIPRSHSLTETQPITIPNRRYSKRSTLLRTDSESSSYAGTPPHPGSSLSSLQEGLALVHVDGHNKHNVSASSSFIGQTSLHSLNSSYSLMRQVSTSSVSSETPPLPPRNGERQPSSGYASPITPSPGLPRSQSYRFGHPNGTVGGALAGMGVSCLDDTSKSDGMTMGEAMKLQHSNQNRKPQHPVSRAGSISRKLSCASEGYESNHSSSEDLAKLPAGWERGYCGNSCRYFYFNSHTGISLWSLQEVLQTTESEKPGAGWKMALTEEGRVYYYHPQTRRTTWDIHETWA